MPSTALDEWTNDRRARLDELEAHCAALLAGPATPTFLDETLRGFVLHLSAHFQAFCRDLYSECSQFWASLIPAGMQTTVASQFSAQLALDKGNPSHENIKKDFNRFGFEVDLQAAHAEGPLRVTHLALLNAWRNKAAHRSRGDVVPPDLSLPEIRDWRASCDGLAASLDAIMYDNLLRTTGVAPW